MISKSESAEVGPHRGDAGLRDRDQAVGALHRAADVGEQVLVAPVAALEVGVEGAHVDRGRGRRAATRGRASGRRAPGRARRPCPAAPSRSRRLRPRSRRSRGRPSRCRRSGPRPRSGRSGSRAARGSRRRSPGRARFMPERREAGDDGDLVAAGRQLAAEVVDVLGHAPEDRVGVLGDHRDPHGRLRRRSAQGRGRERAQGRHDRSASRTAAAPPTAVEPPVVGGGHDHEQHPRRPQEAPASASARPGCSQKMVRAKSSA